MEDVTETRIRDLSWSPHVDDRGVDLTVRLRTDRPAERHLSLRVVLHQGDRLLADDTYAVTSGETRRRITVGETDMSIGHSDMLWTPENPRLIEATITLLEDGAVVDEVGLTGPEVIAGDATAGLESAIVAPPTRPSNATRAAASDRTTVLRGAAFMTCSCQMVDVPIATLYGRGGSD